MREVAGLRALAGAAALLALAPAQAADTDGATTGETGGGSHDNVLFIGRGGLAEADQGDEGRHWSTWPINLVDGSAAYGWLSADSALPHMLRFELAAPTTITGVVLDNRLATEGREDGGLSQSGEGAPVRRFALLGAVAGPDGPFETLYEGEAQPDGRTVITLPAARKARWLRLRIDSNWAGGGATRLSELELLGTPDAAVAPAIASGGRDADVSGAYAHEYGPILLRQQGNEIYGCYSDGLGSLRGTVFGRVMRLAWFSSQEGSIGAATLVAANQRIYGFWYRPDDRMGSPWNAVKTGPLPARPSQVCRAALGL